MKTVLCFIPRPPKQSHTRLKNWLNTLKRILRSLFSGADAFGKTLDWSVADKPHDLKRSSIHFAILVLANGVQVSNHSLGEKTTMTTTVTSTITKTQTCLDRRTRGSFLQKAKPTMMDVIWTWREIFLQSELVLEEKHFYSQNLYLSF